MINRSKLKNYLSNVLISVLLKVAITSAKSTVDFCLSAQKLLTSGSTDVRSAALLLMAFSPAEESKQKVVLRLVQMAVNTGADLSGDCMPRGCQD